MPQAMKIQAAASAVDKELENSTKYQLTKVSNGVEVIDEARKDVKTVHFASSMDLCHLKNSELELKHRNYKGRAVLRGDIVTDNSCSYAVIYRTKVICATDDSRQSRGCHIK